MAQRNPVLLRRAEVGIFGKERKHRRIQIPDQAAIDRNADQNDVTLLVIELPSCRVVASKQSHRSCG
jgi:hypothetical protein